MAAMDPKIRKTEKMHDWRESRPHARYFLTLCVIGRKPVLTAPPVVEAIRKAIGALESGGDFRMIEWVIMPDHLHLLFALGDRLKLGRVVARFKIGTRRALLEQHAIWQRDYYEHRLRPDESSDAYAAYIASNPYRAHLIRTGEIWPHGGSAERQMEGDA